MERHRNNRILVNAEIDIQFFPKYEFMAARTRDLSTNGAFVETENVDAIQNNLVVARIWLQDQFVSRPELVTGIIVRRQQDGFALRFSDSTAIRNYIIGLFPAYEVTSAAAKNRPPETAAAMQ